MGETRGGPGFDAVIVLGTKVEVGGRPSARLERRLRRGVALVQAGAAPLLLVTGGPGHGCGPQGPTEAAVMARLAREAGLPEAAILTEPEALNTWENALYSARLLAGRGLGSALVVSDRLHLWRALLCCRRVGLRVAGKAAEQRWFEEPPHRIAGQALYEAAALLRYLPKLLTRPPSHFQDRGP